MPNLATLLTETAQRHPDRPALKLDDATMSYEALNEATARVADACVIVPTVNPETVTPHAEAFQAVIWHLLVSHPKIKMQQTKWESTR